MVRLYTDPEGEGIFPNTQKQPTTSNEGRELEATSAKITIDALKKRVQELESTLPSNEASQLYWTLLKMDRYCSIIMCHYWDIPVK